MHLREKADESAVPQIAGSRALERADDAVPRQRQVDQDVAAVRCHVPRYGEAVDSLRRVERPAREMREIGDEQAVVPQQVRRRLRHAAPREIGRAGADDAPHLRDLARHQRAVGELAAAHGHVDILRDQIDLAVGHAELDLDARVARQEIRQELRDLVASDGRSGVDPDEPLQAPAGRRHLGFGGLDRRENLPAAPEVRLALDGQRDAPGGAGEKLDAEPLLDPRHDLRDRGRRQAEVVRRGGEAALFRHPHEGIHVVGHDAPISE